MINKQLLKDSLGWGFILWFIGYILGFIFFAIVPQNLIGWVIMPIGLIITLLILFKKVNIMNLHLNLKLELLNSLKLNYLNIR